MITSNDHRSTSCKGLALLFLAFAVFPGANQALAQGGCNTPSFLLMPSISVGTSMHVSIGDLNANGKADLAIAGYNGASIALGNGDGTFGSVVNYTAGTWPQSSVLADFNGDSKLDLAVANWSSNNVSILRGNGDGTFQAAFNYSVGTWPVSIALGDFNGDGKLDLVVANETSNDVSVLLGNGDGTFQAAVNFGVGNSPQSVGVGDFNGDGWPDLAVANSGSNTVSILLWDGSYGTFQFPANYMTGTSPDSVAIGDFNGDGKLDLAVANNGSNNVSILFGYGTGAFQAAVNYGAGPSPHFIVTSDFTRDGRLDLAVANFGSGNISILVGNGDGTFQAALNFGVGSGPIAIAVGDLNGDAKPDLAVVNYQSRNVSILVNARSASCPTIVLSPSNLPTGSVTAEYSQLITASGGTGPYNFSVTGGALPTGLTLSSAGTLSGPPATTGEFAFTITATDANGYTSSWIYFLIVGNRPIASADSASPVTQTTAQLRGSVTPYGLATDVRFEWGPTIPYANVTPTQSIGRGWFPVDVSAFVSSLTPHTTYYYRVVATNSAGTTVSALNFCHTMELVVCAASSFAVESMFATGTNPTSAAVSDFNGDGKLDLAVANYYSANVSVLLGNGNGTFQAAMNYSVGSNPGAVAVGDFNGDGKLDMAVANYYSANVSVLLGNGNGTFQSAVNYSVGSYPTSLAVGDFNRDSKLDLAVANSNPSKVSSLLGNGDGTFQTAVNYLTGSGFTWVVVGEFNGDYKPDLAVADDGSNEVLIFHGNGDGSFQTAIHYGVGLGPQFVGVGDFNGDGRMDLTTANYDSNDESVLLGTCGSSCPAITLSPTLLPVGLVGAAYNQTLTAAGGTAPYNFIAGGGAIPPGLSLSSSGTISGTPTTVGNAYWFTVVATDLNTCGGSRTYPMTVEAAPTATTTAATNVTSNSATLKGIVNPNLLSTTVFFEWGTTTSYGNTTPSRPYGNGNGDYTVSAELTALSSNATYHYRLVATNSAGTSYGADVSFSTVAAGCNIPTFLLMPSIAVGTNTYSVSASDLNGDGKADLAFAGMGGVSIVLGNGDGTFGPITNYNVLPQKSVK